MRHCHHYSIRKEVKAIFSKKRSYSLLEYYSLFSDPVNDRPLVEPPKANHAHLGRAAFAASHCLFRLDPILRASTRRLSCLVRNDSASGQALTAICLEGALAAVPSALPVIVRSGRSPVLSRWGGGRCPWAVFASVGPEDRRRRPEALEGAVDAEEEFPQELRDGRDALQ